MKSYDHKEIEKKWQEKWEDNHLYKVENNRKNNFYCLVEFPYPSGNLHVGHWYAFAVPDIFARYMKMTGKNVLFPIGFDAFGLPAENAAIKRGLNPRQWTYDNIKYMRNQLKSMGASFDWSREIITCDPEYYKWTQWLFIQLFNKGLVYQDNTNVNWCPSCKTVLANEQVTEGHCERCGFEIENKVMKQWMIKITDYAERLLEDLDSLSWPNSIKQSQKEWIGKSEGSLIDFKIKDSSEKIRVFTTRVDTLSGVTFVVLAPEHELISKLNFINKKEVEEYIIKSEKKSALERMENKEKTGVMINNVFAINPVNGKEIPIYVADYVLSTYGTGAIMAVPGHDDRDREFAERHNIEIIPVYLNNILINSGKFNGLSKEEAITKIANHVKAEKTINYKIRDWGVSRQRYWGCPIPIIHCKKCGAIPDKELPVHLPEINDYLPRDDGKSPLAKVSAWVNVKCPKCGISAERETDTLDTFVDSSWYFLRYIDPKNEKEFSSKKIMKEWLPVDFYSGGAEHTTMHLLYSRFFQKALFDLKLVNNDEPYKKRLNRGLILGPDKNKMSKSKGNVIDPDQIVEKLGADTVRMYLAFIGPYNEVGSYPWDPNGVIGIRRFLERVNGIEVSQKTSPLMKKILHQTIKKVTEDCEELKFNTAISSMMVCVNNIEKEGISSEDFNIFLKILSPFAPYLTEELWNKGDESIHLEKWPEYDSSRILNEEIEIVIQINGKMRGKVIVNSKVTEKMLKEIVMEKDFVRKWTENLTVKKFIYIPQKIVSIVAS